MQYRGFPRMKHVCNAAMPVACTVSSFSPGEISKQPAHPSIKPFRPSSFFSLLSIVRPTQIFGVFKKKSNDAVKPFFTFAFFLGKVML